MAIKVIDKMRFPTKQESQLRNEVAILQVKKKKRIKVVYIDLSFDFWVNIFDGADKDVFGGWFWCFEYWTVQVFFLKDCNNV